MRRTLLRAAFALVLFADVQTASADIYTFIDDNGVPNFSDRKTDPRATLFWRDPNGPKGISMDWRPDVLRRPPAAMRPDIDAIASVYGLEPALLAALISVESRYNPRARSPKGAMGLTQLMPATAQRYGVKNAYDVKQNLHGGARYLSDLLVMFNNDVHLALAAFNAGEGAVMKYGRKIPPYAETQRYVPQVLAQLNLLRKHARTHLN
ncbi:lytic transglycosylase domain-containing protein [Uliginosibacterium sp. H3]|uniref:Lytic transglycosylase domain-containing protein n=1 Tax=Uliginosibacterium silvisoli TaxID=3114758 RepID=A0ABU6JZ14_9RHOO|nr:lytic transglycosylase domain-containing protein [Uliginosibacterium sp. H3]